MSGLHDLAANLRERRDAGRPGLSLADMTGDQVQALFAHLPDAQLEELLASIGRAVALNESRAQRVGLVMQLLETAVGVGRLVLV